MKTNKRIIVRPLITLASSAMLIVLCLLQPAAVQAQWTNPNGSGHINNTNSGNVGVNTSNPTTRLHVFEPSGNGVSARVTIQDEDSSAGFNLISWSRSWSFVSDNSPFDGLSISSTGGANFFIGNTGNVGIGTSSPDSRLHLHHSSSNNNPGNIQLSDLGFALRNTNSTNGNMSLISFQDAGGWGNAQFGAIQADQTNHSAHLVFFTRNGAAFGERMRIKNDGNVGIGTPTPTEKLEVDGNVKVSGTVEGGNIKAKYQDVAEWVESSQELQAATVVVLDSSKSNHVVASAHAYDSRVAGVISLQPGIALGEEGEGRVLVATSGRVKVKVDATNGPIEIGDLLVTSDKEGFAMKSSPVDIGGVRIHRPGTLIGKALEPFAKGTGEILVLLSMQ